MKIIKILLVALSLIAFSKDSNAQKIKNKKGITYIDKVPYLKIKGGSLIMDQSPVQIISYKTDKLLFILTKHYYHYYGNTSSFYNEITFADFDISFKSGYDYKPLIQSLYQNGVITEDGNIDEELVKKYMRLYKYTQKIRNY